MEISSNFEIQLNYRYMKKILLFSVCAVTSMTFAQNQTIITKNGGEMSSVVDNTPIPSNKAMWDVQFSTDVTSAAGSSGQAAVAFVNNEFWTSRWANDTLYRFSNTGALLETFTIAGLTGTRSITTDGTHLYMGCATMNIYKVDPVTKSLVSTIPSSAGVESRFLAYDATLDGGAGGFWTGNFGTDIVAVSMTGSMLSSIAAATHTLTGMYGATVDPSGPLGKVLWVFHQGGANNSQMTAIDLNTGLNSGVTRDVFTDIATTHSLTSGLAGGAFFTTAYNGGKSLVALVQGTPSNVIVVYDADLTNSLGENQSNQLSVYPVPATDKITVSMEEAATGIAQLVDLNGKAVQTQVLTGATSFEMEIAGVTPGVYQLIVSAEGTQLVKKVIVQ